MTIFIGRNLVKFKIIYKHPFQKEAHAFDSEEGGPPWMPCNMAAQFLNLQAHLVLEQTISYHSVSQPFHFWILVHQIKQSATFGVWKAVDCLNAVDLMSMIVREEVEKCCRDFVGTPAFL